MEIRGKKVVLIPIKAGEKDEFYKLATETGGSKFWYGEKGRAQYTKEKFFEDWRERAYWQGGY